MATTVRLEYPQEMIDQLDRLEKKLDEIIGEGNVTTSQFGDFVTEEQAKEMLSKKTTWFFNQRKAHKLTGYKLGAKRFYKLSDLIKLVEDGKE